MATAHAAARPRFDAKQVICTILGGALGVGLIFLIGIHVGKQVAPDDMAAGLVPESGSEDEVGPTEASAAMVATGGTDEELDYRFFELLDQPAPKRELPEVDLAMNPVLEERELRKKDARRAKRHGKRGLDRNQRAKLAADAKYRSIHTGEAGRSVTAEHYRPTIRSMSPVAVAATVAPDEAKTSDQVAKKTEKKPATAKKTAKKTETAKNVSAAKQAGASSNTKPATVAAPKSAPVAAAAAPSKVVSAASVARTEQKPSTEPVAKPASRAAAGQKVDQKAAEQKAAAKTTDQKAAADQKAADKKAADKKGAADKKAAKKADDKKRSRGRFTVQVSAFQEKGAANALASDMRSLGYKVYVKAEDVPGRGTWYRVQVGRYGSREEATKAKETISSKSGFDGFITAR